MDITQNNNDDISNPDVTTKESRLSDPMEEDNTSQTMNDDINPLEIDMLLETVIGHLTPSSLLTCLSVNKTWRKAALAERSCRTLFEIKSPADLISLLDTFKSTSIKISRLSIHYQIPSILFNKLHNYKLTRYLESLVLIHPETPPDSVQLGNLIQGFPNLLNLSLYWPPSRPLPPNYPTSIPQPFFPLLKESGDPLTIENIIRLEFTSRSSHPLYLSAAFRTFPNLLEVSITNMESEPINNFKQCDLTKLKNLRIQQEPGHRFEEINKVLGMLDNLKLKLHTLAFSLNKYLTSTDMHIDLNLLQRVILNQQQTLKTLELLLRDEQIGKVWRVNIRPFPLNLPNLTTLHVSKDAFNNFAQLINHLPSLQELKVSTPVPINWKDFLPSTLQQHNSLQILRTDYLDNESLHRFLNCFPSLKILQINYRNPEQELPYLTGRMGDAIWTIEAKCEVCGIPAPVGNGNLMVIYRDDDPGSEMWSNLDILILGSCPHSISKGKKPVVIILTVETPPNEEQLRRKRRVSDFASAQITEALLFRPGASDHNIPISHLWLRGWEVVFIAIN